MATHTRAEGESYGPVVMGHDDEILRRDLREHRLRLTRGRLRGKTAKPAIRNG